MNLKLSRSMWIISAVGIILILALLVVNPNVLQVLLSVPLVLFLPGFALTLILFPWRSLGLPERLLLSFGLSLAFTALSGLLLNLTPWGLQPKTLWLALLLMIAVEIAVLIFTRRTLGKDRITFPTSLNFNVRQWVLMALAAFMTIMAVYIARTPTPQQGLQGYTLLWIKPADTPGTIHVGVQSEEFKATDYQIKYKFNGAIQDGPTVQLNPGETWEESVSVPTDKLAGKPFTILLYRLSNPTKVYRHVNFWPESQ